MYLTVILCPKGKTLNNNFRFVFKKGALSVDFVFTFCAGLLLLLYFLMVSWTLSLMEVSQYIAFKTSRTLFAGHINLKEQVQESEEKFMSLRERFFKPSVMDQWFKLERQAGLDNNSADPNSGNLFLGVQLEFTSKVLGLEIPFLKDKDAGVKFDIASYLGREPSQEECEKFKKVKFNQLKQLDPSYSVISTPPNFFRRGNGC